MKTVAILTILTIIPWAGTILNIVAVILLFLCLGDISRVNMQLHSKPLENYRSNFTAALVLRLIIAILAIIGWFFPIDFLSFMYTKPLNFLINGVGWILIIIAGAIEMVAWQSFMNFTVQSTTLFPTYIRGNVMDGSKQLKNAGLMSALIFLFITFIIGWIFQIIGYFKLAKLEEMEYAESPVLIETALETTPKPPFATSPIQTKFSPNCGA